MEIPNYQVLCSTSESTHVAAALITSDFKATYFTSKLNILLLLALSNKTSHF